MASGILRIQSEITRPPWPYTFFLQFSVEVRNRNLLHTLVSWKPLCSPLKTDIRNHCSFSFLSTSLSSLHERSSAYSVLLQRLHDDIRKGNLANYYFKVHSFLEKYQSVENFLSEMQT